MKRSSKANGSEKVSYTFKCPVYIQSNFRLPSATTPLLSRRISICKATKSSVVRAGAKSIFYSSNLVVDQLVKVTELEYLFDYGPIQVRRAQRDFKIVERNA